MCAHRSGSHRPGPHHKVAQVPDHGLWGHPLRRQDPAHVRHLWGVGRPGQEEDLPDAVVAIPRWPPAQAHKVLRLCAFQADDREPQGAVPAIHEGGLGFGIGIAVGCGHHQTNPYLYVHRSSRTSIKSTRSSGRSMSTSPAATMDALASSCSTSSWSWWRTRTRRTASSTWPCRPAFSRRWRSTSSKYACRSGKSQI